MKYSTLIFDLDGTLAPSKERPSESMCQTLCEALKQFKIAIISGARFEQFQKQLLTHLSCADLSNMILAPTNGAAIYIFSKGEWECLEKRTLTEEEKKNIFEVFNKAIKEFNVSTENLYGVQVEDRETQITFSGCGSTAPIEVKEKWDPDESLRIKMANYMKELLPEFEIKVGGMTSIDVTRKGFDKARAIDRIQQYLNVPDEQVLFMGDALFPNGNDEPAKKTGVDTIQVKNPEDTEEKIKGIMNSV